MAVMSATRKIGAVAVPLNYRLTPEEARYVVGHSDAEIAYVDAEYARLFTGLAGTLEHLREVIVFGGPPPEPGCGKATSSRPLPRISRRTSARRAAPAGR